VERSTHSIQYVLCKYESASKFLCSEVKKKFTRHWLAQKRWFRCNLVRIREVLWRIFLFFASVNRITEIYWSPSTICLRLNKMNVRTTVFTNFHDGAPRTGDR
jgi:hypothetical protein